MLRAQTVRILSATMVMAFALTLNAGASSATPKYHLSIAGTVKENEGAFTCDVAMSTQATATLKSSFEVAVRTSTGKIAKGFSGTVAVVLQPSNASKCPYMFLDGSATGVGTGSLTNTSAPLVHGVATFTALSGTAPGKYLISLRYQGLSSASTPFVLDVGGANSVTTRPGMVTETFNTTGTNV
jgi:hypothetical protein